MTVASVGCLVKLPPEPTNQELLLGVLKVQQVLKETNLSCSLKLNTKKLLVVLECLNDRAFNSADCLCSFVIIPLARSVVEC